MCVCVCVTCPGGVLGQVRYFIASVPDLCLHTHFVETWIWRRVDVCCLQETVQNLEYFLEDQFFSTFSSGQERTLELEFYWRRSV